MTDGSLPLATHPLPLPHAEGGISAGRLLIGLFAIWSLASLILLWVARRNIAGLEMWDPDDYLRLQQVRDWLGGQSFFDVTQYRIDPPQGVPMHWSRLVDLPLAGMILLLRPLLGPAMAEQASVSIVPLFTLGGVLGAVALLTARLADRRAALLAAMLGATAPLLLFHLLPLRIDHHGWQTMLGLFAVGACFDPAPRRGGLAAGITTALWLGISLEALPMAAALGLVLALRYLVWGERERFRAFAGSLGLMTLGLFAALHGDTGWGDRWCDAMSPAWFGPMILTPLLAALSTLSDRRAARCAGLAFAALAGIATLAASAPACLAGPFAQLDPLVRLYWYDNVPEGLPIWRQAPANAMLLVGFPLIGLAGTVLAWRYAPSASRARDWLTMLILLCSAFVISLLVQRAGGFTQGCSLPGAGWLLARVLGMIDRKPSPLLRIPASAAAVLSLSPIGAMAAGALLLSATTREVAPATSGSDACFAPCASLAPLRRLPRAAILTGLDLTPRLLVETPHAFAASGHHRGRAAMARVIAAFIGPPATARRLMREKHMTYLLIAPGGNEARIYAKAAPDGLAARLLRGEVPRWLVPVPLGTDKLLLWRRLD